MFTIIFTEDALYITKQVVDDWRDIQSAYRGYKSSLAGFTVEGLIDYLDRDYPTQFDGSDRTWRHVVDQFAAASALDTIRI